MKKAKECSLSLSSCAAEMFKTSPSYHKKSSEGKRYQTRSFTLSLSLLPFTASLSPSLDTPPLLPLQPIFSPARPTAGQSACRPPTRLPPSLSSSLPPCFPTCLSVCLSVWLPPSCCRSLFSSLASLSPCNYPTNQPLLPSPLAPHAPLHEPRRECRESPVRRLPRCSRGEGAEAIHTYSQPAIRCREELSCEPGIHTHVHTHTRTPTLPCCTTS